jgi:hypothetical protein
VDRSIEEHRRGAHHEQSRGQRNAREPGAERWPDGSLFGERREHRHSRYSRLHNRAAGIAAGKMRENLRALAIEQRVFSEGGQQIGVGVRFGRLALSQTTAQRAGGYWLHGADPSLL